MQARVAAADDVPELVALIERAYRGDAARAGWTHEADMLGGQRIDAAMLGAMIADPDHLLLLFEQDGTPVACVHVERRGGAGYVGLVTVEPRAQGSGWGRRLLDAAESAARDRFGAACARMSVIAQRAELIAWYERRGYAATGETAPFPYGDARFGAPKRDDLHFIILEKPLRAAAGGPV